MSDSIPEQFTGMAAYEVQDPKKFDLKPHSYTPRPFLDTDVDVQIEASGICGSDVHTITQGWGNKLSLPAIVGHEIVGIVRRAGPDSGHKVGDRVGFGAQCDSCGHCDSCKDGVYPNYCKNHWCGTYQGKNKDGSFQQGGYADYYRGNGKFAVKVPEGLDSAVAAPLFCAGVTVYSPLSHHGCGPNKKVGIVGVGGLGHLGIQFAKALGADVYAISHSASKREDAKKLGATDLLESKDPKALLKAHANSFDLILSTSFQADLDPSELFLPLLKPRGVLSVVGLPEEPLRGMRAQALLGRSIAGSLIGSPQEISDMLNLAVKHDIKPWIEKRPLSQASQAVQDLENGKAKYRYVLIPGQ